MSPSKLRIAYLAWGTGVGPLYFCVFDLSDNLRLLVTSDALATGNFMGATVATPLAPGSISTHFTVPTSVTALLGGRVIEVWRAADAGAVISGGVGACVPVGTATPLASAPLGGSAPGAIQLVPGQSATVAIVGGAGPELMSGQPTACGGGLLTCPAVAIVTLVDEAATSTAATARVRVVNADPRFGAPGICQDLYGNPSPALTTIPSGVVPYVATLAPSYEDVAPVAAAAIPDGDGGVTVIPRLVTVHPVGAGTTSATLCSNTPVASTIAGTIPNAGLIAQFAMNAASGAATVRPDLPANAVTSLFIVPLTLQFRDAANAGATCNAGSSMSCLPAEQCSTPSTSCVTIPVAIPVADSP